ncbi:unnamed protein product, partial [Rotaria sordida]
AYQIENERLKKAKQIESTSLSIPSTEKTRIYEKG